MKQMIIDFIADNWQYIAPVLMYEITVRLKPTKQNLSLMDALFKFVSFILPNYSSHATELIKTDKVTGEALDEKTDVTMKHVVKLIILFCFISFSSFAQLNQSAKAYFSYNADSATIRTNMANIQLYYGNSGGLYYNKQSSKWRIYSDSTWHDLLGGSGGGSGTVTGNFVPVRVPYAVGSHKLHDTPYFKYDSVNHALIIGTATIYDRSDTTVGGFNMFVGAQTGNLTGTFTGTHNSGFG